MKEEPQIIHYYCSFPEYAIVIENLNKEYEELISNYIILSDRIEPHSISRNKIINYCFIILLCMIACEISIIFILI